MRNETTIKVPKKYQHLVASIAYSDSWRGKYELEFEHVPGMEEYCHMEYHNSQLDVLDSIRIFAGDLEEFKVSSSVQEVIPAEEPETVEDCLEMLAGNERLSACLADYSDLVDAVATEFDDNATRSQIISELGSRFPLWDFRDMDTEEWADLFRRADTRRNRIKEESSHEETNMEANPAAETTERPCGVETAVPSDTPEVKTPPETTVTVEPDRGIGGTGSEYPYFRVTEKINRNGTLCLSFGKSSVSSDYQGVYETGVLVHHVFPDIKSAAQCFRKLFFMRHWDACSLSNSLRDENPEHIEVLCKYIPPEVQFLGGTP